MSDLVERPLRADAERNRRRIIDAARELFAQRGLDVSMEQIAAAAGVGVGTLYRRFAARDELIDAIFEEKAAAMVAIAERALEIEDPWNCLEHFVRNVCRFHAADRGFKEAVMCSGRGAETLRMMRERIHPIAGQVLRRAQDAGVVRSDVDTFDVPMLNFAMGYIAERTRDEAPDFYERLLTILLDGLRPARDGVTPMPGPPLTEDQFARMLTQR